MVEEDPLQLPLFLDEMIFWEVPGYTLPMQYWGLEDYFQSIHRDLEGLQVASKQVFLDNSAISVLQVLLDKGLDSLAEDFPKFCPKFISTVPPYDCRRADNQFDLSGIKLLIAQILANQRDLRSQVKFCSRITAARGVKRSAENAAKAFVSLLEHWISLEKRCGQSMASDDEVVRWKALMRHLKFIRIRLNLAAENNTWEQLCDRTLSLISRAFSSDRHHSRRHTLNTVYLPLLI